MSADRGDLGGFFGARLLGGDEPSLIPRPLTSGTITLRSTQLQCFTLVEDNKVVGYQFSLNDTGERRTYIFRFAEEIREMLEGFFEKSPHVGDEIPEEDDEEDTGGVDLGDPS